MEHKTAMWAFVVPALLAGCFTSWAPAATWTVDCSGGGDFTAIQEAVDASSDGDTLLVMPCLYAETVALQNRSVSIVGCGAENTILYWDGTEPTLVVDCPDSGPGLGSRSHPRVSGMLLEHADNASIWYVRPAVRVHNGVVELNDCVVVYGASVASNPENYNADADILATSCEFDHLRVWGQDEEISVLEDCRIGGLSTSAGYDWTGSGTDAVVFSSSCRVGFLNMSGGRVRSASDSIGTVLLYNSSHARSDVRATDSIIGFLHVFCGFFGPRAHLSQCVVDSVYWWADSAGTLSIEGSVVGGGYMAAYGSGIMLVHNTFTGAINTVIQPSGVELASNIFMGDVSGEASPGVPFLNNDFVVGHSLTGGVFVNNIEADPLFCGAAGGNFTLQECSPCAGSAHDGGDIGAFGVGCECSTTIRESSWGRIKSLFRQPSN